MSSLSKTFRANRQKVTDTDGVLVLLEITHPKLEGPLRFVNDTQSCISKQETYVGYPFELQLPSDTQGEHGVVKIALDNIGLDVLSEIDTVKDQDPSQMFWCKVIIADRSTPNEHDITFKQPMTVASADAQVITITLSMDFLFRRSAILLRHDPATSAGIFQI